MKITLKMQDDTVDTLIVECLTEQLNSLEELPDEFETPDNIAADIAALYRVLSIFMPHDQYKQFVKNR